MNKVILMGRLTSDPEIRYTQNKLAVARYTLAVNRKGHTENTADFIRCVAFDHAAEFAEKYFKQGTKIIITGRIQTGSYTNKDGQKVYITEVAVEEQEFAESKSANKPKQQEAPGAGPNGFMNIPDGVEDEDLPFN